MRRLSLAATMITGLILGFISSGVTMAATGVTNPAPKKSTITVFYFHGKLRCPTCIKIEKLSTQAVGDAFQDELKRGLMEWRVVDVDMPENRHFNHEFALESSTLAVARYEGDKLRKFIKLEKVWDLVEGDGQAFAAYVREEIERFMTE